MDTSDEAGDPFVESTETEPKHEVLGEIEEIQGSMRTAAPELEDTLNALDAFEVEKEENKKAEESAKTITIDEVRAIVRTTAKAVEDATANLEKAHKAYSLACALEVSHAAVPTLAELNRAQVRVTATETRQRARAMKALGALGFGEPKRKPHPPLF